MTKPSRKCVEGFVVYVFRSPFRILSNRRSLVATQPLAASVGVRCPTELEQQVPDGLHVDGLLQMRLSNGFQEGLRTAREGPTREKDRAARQLGVIACEQLMKLDPRELRHHEIAEHRIEDA